MKRRYTCDDLGGSPIGECRDFYPSLTTAQMSGGRGENEEKYLAFQEKCAESAEAETDYYAEQGCKRRAHRMLPGGRSETRYGSPDGLQAARSGLSYPQRLERLETSLRHRTQPVRPAPARAEVVPIGTSRVSKVEELLTRASLGENQDQLSPLAYRREALPDLQEMAEQGLIDSIRLDKFTNRADKGERVSLTFAGKVGEPASGLAARVGNKILAFNERLSNTLTSGSRKKEAFSVAPDFVDGARLILRTDRGIKADFPKEARIIAINGNQAPFADLQRRAANFQVPQGKEKAAPYAIAMLLFFFKAVSDNADSKGRVRLTIMGYDDQPYTLDSVSLKGLQHSDVVQASDPKRKSYYTFRNLSKREVAEYLLGLRPRTVQRKKRRGRYLTPLAKDNPVAKPSFLDIDQYTDLEPGQMRPVAGNPRYCVYRKIVKEPVPREQEFVVTTCSRARSWQKLNQVNQVARRIVDAEETAALNPMEAPMARSRRNYARNNGPATFDPLAELMKEFGDSARLGAKITRGAPDFDAPTAHGADPYAISKGPYGARSSIPTNRRNPRKSRSTKKRAATGWNREFGRLAKEASAYQAARGCSLKDAWAAVRGGQRAAANPNELHEYHSTGPFTMDYESPYEQIRGAYEGTPAPNRRNPGYRSMKGAQLEALANRGDAGAAKEMGRRKTKRNRL